MSEEDPKRTAAKLKRIIATAKREVSSILVASRNAKKDKAKHLPLFEGMYTALEKYYSMYENAFHDLSIIAEQEEELVFPSEEDTTADTNMRNSYYEIKTSYITLTKPETSSSSSRTSLNETATVVHEHSDSHLPEIKLIPFDGEILNWPKFRDVFVSVVEESKLTPAKKFHYLITNLKGPALSLVNKFQITDQNYPLAWAALCETYDKQRLLATAYLNRVLNFPQMQGKPSIDMLKSFMTTVCDSISSFELLAITNESKFILFHLAFRLLDPVTREQFQNVHKETEFPTFEQLLKFIRDRCFNMQLTSETNSNFDSSPSASKQNHSNFPKNKGKFNKNNSRSSGKASLVAHESNVKPSQNKSRDPSFPNSCFICNDGSHGLLSCRKFCSADVNQRITWLADWNGCKNCLSGKHSTVSCKSKWVCRWCKQQHNSMLCANEPQNKTATGRPLENASSGAYCTTSPGSYAVTQDDSQSHVILGTLMAEVLDARNVYQTVRIVVDSASHYSFMTYKCANRLGLAHNKCNFKISGIGQSQEGARNFVNCGIKPVGKSAPILPMKALLLRSITSHLPTVSLPRQLWMKYCKFPLADATFFESQPVDILMDAGLFSEIWIDSPIELDSNSPKLFPTIFGHVVMGKFTAPCTNEPQPQTSHGASLIATNPISIDDINLSLRRFWEVEEVKPVKVIDPEESYCEDHFKATKYRLEDGSYGVRLPFRSSPPEFTNISTIAKRRFRNQENRLLKNNDLREKYVDFMKEYEQLGHMTVSETPPAYVIPHHAISKIDRNQSKLRVVFDGSAQSINGSLNDYLLVGPKLQTDIRDVLLNFRLHKCALVADIVKCFRAIWMHPDDRKYQTIFWRYNPYDALQVYELNTVVYGLSSSPYLANRVVQAIVEDHGSAYPEASEVLKRDIYVDDIVTGCDSIENATKLQSQLIELLGEGQFKLSKWASNCPELLKNVSDTSSQPVTIISKDDTSVKILGLQWNPATDCFSYNLELPNHDPTKRSILSNVSKIYDPLGFISPLVITMKQFLQECWKLGVDWDESVPIDLGIRWESALKQLPIISNISIPRFVCSESPSAYQIVGFADASETAYCATLYLRVISQEEIKTSLLTAKTKLAPLKKLTIPRLELCGCFLLARLYQSIAEFLSLLQPNNLLPPRFFTDSTVALGWIHTPTFKLKTFVCNRVSEILQVTSVDEWHHVSSSDNPADMGSRGFLPDQLLNNSLWWNGPKWLACPETAWNLQSPLIQPDKSEMKKERVALMSVESPAALQSIFIVELISRFSSFNRLLRSLAHVLRFVKNLRDKKKRICGPLTLSEIRSAQTLCVKAVQAHFFFKDDFSEKGQMKVMKKFVKLNPFVDVEGILRAGGRLYNANLPYNHKHPVLLPPESKLAILIIDHFHRMYLHPGPSLLHAVVQMEFWIPSLRRLAQQRVYQCKRCYRLKAKACIPKMADLPPYRVQAARAFLKTGLDFCGPFWMKDSRRRKPQLSKVYLCIFICMATKAIHIEAVTSLSADAFLAALDRFVSLRGLPTDCFSDCGSNFISAARQLKEWYEWFASEQAQSQIAENTTVRHINWHFNPPYAPHFGGIWEAGVKSAKSIMIRSIGDTVLTYEELATLVAKISAVLNSRPLCPLSTDPSECEYLSPGHFLIGESPLAIPEPTLLDVAMNRLDRWQLVKRLSQHFWERWHKEYLLTLQKRNKWSDDAPNLKVGDLVFLKDDNQPILQWSRGRIIKIHPGDDGNVRVATVKTSTSTFTRPVAKLIPLSPPEDSPEDPTVYDPPEGEKKRYRRWIRGSDPDNDEEEEESSAQEPATD